MKTLEILDVCLPDYFTGYHRPVIAIPVYNNMLISELAQSIKDELNASYDYLTNDSNGFTKTEILIIDEYVNKLMLRGGDVFIGQEFEEGNEFDDCCFAYLSIIKPVYSHGMKFLS